MPIVVKNFSSVQSHQNFIELCAFNKLLVSFKHCLKLLKPTHRACRRSTIMDAKAREYIANDIKDEDCFDTIQRRQPDILRNAANFFMENYKDYLKNKHSNRPLNEEQNEEADADAKTVYDDILEYIEKPVNNENLTKIDDEYADVHLWNLRLEEYVKEHHKQPDYLNTSILWVECYMYRTLASALFKSKYFKEFDMFYKIKCDGLYSSRIAATKLIEHTANIKNRIATNKSTVEEEFENFLSFALWGNRFDLSCDYGFTNTDNFQLVDDLKKQKPKIVSNATLQIYEHFKSAPNKIQQITIVLDNAGFELLGDLCFVEMLYQTDLVDEKSKIIFHDKLFQWFVSDVVHHDFTWLLNCLLNDFESDVVKSTAQRWLDFLTDGRWSLKTHLFWTTCWSFCEMRRLAPELYNELAKSSLVLFCGDLNYRKLISDFLWELDTPFEVALRGFWPTNIVSIRTIKCRPVVAVEKHVKLPEDYWHNGDHAVIHFYKKK